MLARCGRYQLLGEVGSGAMGVVYRAHDPKIDRLVAVKVLRQEHVADGASTGRFLKEARAIGRLSHPNIVAMYDMGEEQGNYYFTMELVEGRSLSEKLQERHLAITDAVGIGVQIASALDYAHRRGVIHQDIKPGNILIADDGKVKITDFGIARLQDVTATVLTKAGEIMGTPSYMSPEQIEGKAVDGRTDIYSLGVVLYTMVTGGKPFGRSETTTLASLLNEILHVSPLAPIAASSEVPKRLSDLILKALRKDPQQRFLTGGEMAAALKKCLAEPAAARVEAPRAAVAKPSMRNVLPAKVARPGMRIALLVAVAVAMVVAIVGIVYFVFREPPKSGSKRPQQGPQVGSLVPGGSPPAPRHKQEIGLHDPVPGIKNEVTTPNKEQSKIGSDKSVPDEKITPPAPPELAIKPVQAPGGRTPLLLISTPPGSRVYIDNDFRGTTPLNVMLSIGQHHVKVTKVGFRDAEMDFSMEETMEYPLAFTLDSAEASGR